MPDFLTILRAWRLLALHLDNFNSFFPQALGELWSGSLVRDQPRIRSNGPILETLLRPSLLKSATTFTSFAERIITLFNCASKNVRC